MSNTYLNYLLAEQRKLVDAKSIEANEVKIQRLLASCHPKQRQFVRDPRRRIAALVARRGGKTTGGRVRFVYRGLKQKANMVYLALTRAHAEELMWEPLKELAEKLEIEAHFNETKLVMTFKRTGAVLKLMGADDKREIEKLRGRKFHEVGIDEAASYPSELLEAMVFRIIGPGLTDYRGPLWLIGTPGHILQGLFFEATRQGSKIGVPSDQAPLDPRFLKWSTHQWSLQDNTAMPHLWDEALLEKAANEWSDDNPIWKREYCGLWAMDDTGYVYRYRRYTDDGAPWNVWTPGHNTLFGLPEGYDWRFIYGMDLGFGDPFALQILAFSEYNPNLYQAYEFSKTKMTVREINDLLDRLIAKTGYPEAIVADTSGLGDMVVAELAQTYGKVIEPAKKKNKLDAVELVNSDLVDGRLKVIDGSELEKEMLTLQWDETGLKEDENLANHNCDAVIYARRKAMHLFSRERPSPPPTRGTQAWYEKEMQRQEEEASRVRTPEEEWIKDEDYTRILRW